MDYLPINKYIKYILDVIEKQCFKKILFLWISTNSVNLFVFIRPEFMNYVIHTAIINMVNKRNNC